MIVRFSHHALEKIRRRGVSMSHVHQTLRIPDELYEDVEHGTMIAIKKVNSRFIILAYRGEDEVVKVITLYYTSKFDRLIRSKTVRSAWKKIA